MECQQSNMKMLLLESVYVAKERAALLFADLEHEELSP